MDVEDRHTEVFSTSPPAFPPSYLGEDSVDGHLLLEQAAGEVDLSCDVAAVDLDLADVRLLLPQLHKANLYNTTQRAASRKERGT